MAPRKRIPKQVIAQLRVNNLKLKNNFPAVNFQYEDQVEVTLKTGEVLAVVGPNGVGKSALVEELSRSLTAYGSLERFSGHRQISFQSENVGEFGQTLESFQAQILNHQQVNRLRNPWGDQHLQSVVKRLMNRQHQDNHDFLEAVRSGRDITEVSEENILMLDELNGVFEAARLTIKIVLQDGNFKAKRGSNTYGIDRMSDGERAALLLVGAILVRPTSTWIIFDEPEKHLNPAISGPLIAAALRARPDLGYIFATHDLSLLEWLKPQQAIHVSDSEVIHLDPEVRRYKLEFISGNSLPSEDLRAAVFGSRKALLLVEGDELSEEEALLGLIYKNWNISGRGGWESVSTEVKGIDKNKDLHWLKVAGIIDADGRNAEEQEKYAKRNIFSLPCPTIENLFFYKPVVESMIELMANLHGGKSFSERLDSYLAIVLPAIREAKDEIVFRRVVWRANRSLSENKVSVRKIRDGQSSISGIDLNFLRAEVVSEIDEAILHTDPEKIIMRVPIKNTKVPAKLSEEIGFDNFIAYKNSIIHQAQSDSAAGKKILKELAAILPKLPSV